MITAVRLRPYARRGANRMRTYTAVSGKKYEAGFAGGDPSPIYAVDSTDELREFEAIEQFQILHFDSLADLHELVQREMEIVARRGGNAVRARMIGFPAVSAVEVPVAPVEAQIEQEPPKPRSRQRPKPRPAMDDMVAPTLLEEPAHAHEPAPEPEATIESKKTKPRVRKTPKRSKSAK